MKSVKFINSLFHVKAFKNAKVIKSKTPKIKIKGKPIKPKTNKLGSPKHDLPLESMNKMLCKINKNTIPKTTRVRVAK